MRGRQPFPVFSRTDGILAVSLLCVVQDRLTESRRQEPGGKTRGGHSRDLKLGLGLSNPLFMLRETVLGSH